MVWREDCVDCAVAVLTQDGHENAAYAITGPNLETFADVAAMLTGDLAATLAKLQEGLASPEHAAFVARIAKTSDNLME